jgi:ATP-dependent Lon protease
MNESMNTVSQTLPLFPLRNSILFPYVVAPYSAGRPRSIAALEAALASEEKLLAVVTQRNPEVEEPGLEDLYELGTRAVIRQMARSDETMEVVIQGIERIRVTRLDRSGGRLDVIVQPAPVTRDEGAQTEAEALQRELAELARQVPSISQQLERFGAKDLLNQIQDPMQLVYLLGSTMGLDMERAQQLLAASGQHEAMKLLHGYLLHERQVAELRKEIAGQAESEMGRQQREYLLRQQLRAIQQELGEESPEQSEAAELRRRFEEAELPPGVRKETERELHRLESIPTASPEHQVARAHLELILELPWTKRTEDNLDLARARRILDEDHYDLPEIKERILEHLAVLRLNPEAHAPILCFVGPPGVGKTSLGQSIARSLGRKFERFSLGGLHDEAELRGHRRTYIGAMPGRIIQAIRRAESNNPLLMLDEVDKLGRDFRGDPASALLEILDPAQNNAFRDNYLDLPFDLSGVFFITTANTLDTVPGPLLDRMETLRLSGYSDEEKLEIARRYLIGRQRRQAGLTEEEFQVPDETVLRIIGRYTREAGVRELERMLGRIARKVALRIAEEKAAPAVVSPEALADLLGPERFLKEEARRELPAGVATGLAWTPTGGDVLYVEAIRLPQDGKLTLTGQLGDVMKESAQAAQNWVLSQAVRLGIDNAQPGIHIHVPAGAIPKDGPSAGVTIATAVASLYTDRPVRNDTALTGEISLTGLLLPVGGIKEKLLAARRAGLKRVILPRGNEKDLCDLPESVRDDLVLIFAERIEEVLLAAIPDLPEVALTAP